MLSLILGLAIAAQPPAPPPPLIPNPGEEAITLGRRLAATGTLANLLPLVAQRETEEMIARNPDFTDAERATLRQVARETMQSGMARITDSMGRALAGQLQVADLRLLVAAAETDAARRERAALPAILTATMQTIGQMDFGRDVRAAMCQRTQRMCPEPPRQPAR